MPPCGTRGAFVYVPKNVKVDLPLQVIMHQARAGVGGYHHTLLVAEPGAEVTLVDDLLGGHDGLQSAVVELVSARQQRGALYELAGL